MNRSPVRWVLLALAAFGCQSSTPSSDIQPSPATTAQPSTPAASSQPSATNAPSTTPAPSTGTAKPDDLGARLGQALGAALAGSAPGNVEADGDCPILFPPADDEIAAQAKAIVPLKAGLTLSHLWRTIESPADIECLAHVETVGPEVMHVSNTCLKQKDQEQADSTFSRRTCRTDMRRARVFQTFVGTSVPETIVGVTSYSLSRDAYLELKRNGTTRHQYIELMYKGSGAGFTRGTVFQAKLEGTLTLEGTGTLTTIVNAAPTDLPVLRLSGTLRGTAYDKPAETRVRAAAIDDERFPLMLEYRLLDLGAHEFSVRYTKISYPTEGAIEKRLAEAKRVDVYGIYFDFASDRIRKESEPVLKEIADALQKNADWTLSIEGHTDSVGSDAANLDLSQRRSASVRTALVERYRIAADRLTTAGYGEGAPKDTNDTPEGRARNRRVELVRR